MYCWEMQHSRLNGLKQEKNIFIRKSAEEFIYSVSFFSCANLTRRALLIKCSIKLYFSKERRGAYCFLMPRLFGVALFRLNAIGYCVFRKSAAAVFFGCFCPTCIEGGVLSRIYGLDSFCRFYYICGQFVLHLSALLHLWSIFITFVGFTTFVANYYICGFNMGSFPIYSRI